MVLKHSKQITIFVTNELLEEIEKYFHQNGFRNRSRAIVDLIKKGLQKTKEEQEK